MLARVGDAEMERLTVEDFAERIHKEIEQFKQVCSNKEYLEENDFPNEQRYEDWCEQFLIWQEKETDYCE